MMALVGIGGFVVVATMGLPDVTWLVVEINQFDIGPRLWLDSIPDYLANRLAGAHCGQQSLASRVARPS